MSVRRRKLRPLERDREELRDDRKYLVACDDTYAPKQYFEGFRNEFLKDRLEVKVIPTPTGKAAGNGESAPQYVLKRLQDAKGYEDYDEKWIILDIDRNLQEGHRHNFLSTLSEARRYRINVAISNPCFEYWLLLHHLPSSDSRSKNLKNAKATEKLLREVLGEYNKTNLKREDYPIEKVALAIKEAKEVDSNTKGEDDPKINTTRVYKIWEQIISNSVLEQLPQPLKELKSTLS